MNREKNALWIAGIAFLALAAAVLLLRGSSYTLKIPVNAADGAGAAAYRVNIEQDREIIALTEQRLEAGTLYLSIRSVSPGRAILTVEGPDVFAWMELVYVHRFGIISVDSPLGSTAGDRIIPVLVTLYLALLLRYAAVRYRRGMRESLYQYKNIRNLGWILFLALMLLGQIPYLLSGNSLSGTVRSTLQTASNTAFIAFPVAFVLSILVACSNIQLMRREGRNWRNMLGLLLGLFVCLSTLFPFLLSEFLQRTTLVDVHNEQGLALYVEMAVTSTILIAVSYLECILWATIILAVRAARRIPAFDRDYMLILGCRIRKDGGLTPLLKGRADRALEFARLQKEKSGKDLIFVPSGGKGADECIPEAQAIRDYLLEAGVPEDRILPEDASADTYENFRNSLALIRAHSTAAEPRIAFSTTNYHVFRSGILARQQGVSAEGIGSRTRSYFWINAFVREFIATVASEWRRHLRVIAVLVLLTLALVGIIYLSNIL